MSINISFPLKNLRTTRKKLANKRKFMIITSILLQPHIEYSSEEYFAMGCMQWQQLNSGCKIRIKTFSMDLRFEQEKQENLPEEPIRPF